MGILILYIPVLIFYLIGYIFTFLILFKIVASILTSVRLRQLCLPKISIIDQICFLALPMSHIIPFTKVFQRTFIYTFPLLLVSIYLFVVFWRWKIVPVVIRLNYKLVVSLIVVILFVVQMLVVYSYNSKSDYWDRELFDRLQGIELQNLKKQIAKCIHRTNYTLLADSERNMEATKKEILRDETYKIGTIKEGRNPEIYNDSIRGAKGRLSEYEKENLKIVAIDKLIQKDIFNINEYNLQCFKKPETRPTLTQEEFFRFTTNQELQQFNDEFETEFKKSFEIKE